MYGSALNRVSERAFHPAGPGLILGNPFFIQCCKDLLTAHNLLGEKWNRGYTR